MPTVGVSLVGAATATAAAAEHMQTITPQRGGPEEREGGKGLPLRESQRACLCVNVGYKCTCVYVCSPGGHEGC